MIRFQSGLPETDVGSFATEYKGNQWFLKDRIRNSLILAGGVRTVLTTFYFASSVEQTSGVITSHVLDLTQTAVNVMRQTAVNRVNRIFWMRIGPPVTSTMSVSLLFLCCDFNLSPPAAWPLVQIVCFALPVSSDWPVFPELVKSTPSIRSGGWPPVPALFRHQNIHRTEPDPASADRSTGHWCARSWDGRRHLLTETVL